ncbi:hypothetical protein AW736_13525 [Termitidicoccus mucosus]|uniref:GtrA/DPMS transmembrane domain-containing protein n=2 Tax=Termitidicoccus mucosus TaxID=1184151 RepID=A0A178II09_9BACT|nr:hypothetical protein AW736_13525 [Opitutaceae bacterium TSB47]
MIGGSTFALDLLLLFLLKELINLHYAFAASIAFFVAVSINYAVSRSVVFKGTVRSFNSGYLIFVFIAGGGLVAVALLMLLCVDMLGMNYLLARITIACLVGIWTYLMNLFINFKVAGKP